jgi:hypothetical protein
VLTVPRLEVGVAEPREPRVSRREAGALLEEAEGDNQRRERMTDRGVAPVEHPQVLAARVQVRVVEVVVLDRLRHVEGCELHAQLREPRREVA